MGDDEFQRKKMEWSNATKEETTTDGKPVDKPVSFADVIQKWGIYDNISQTKLIEGPALTERFLKSTIPGQVRVIAVNRNPMCPKCERPVDSIEVYLSETSGRIGRVIACHGEREFRLYTVPPEERQIIREGFTSWSDWTEMSIRAPIMFPPKAEPPAPPEVDGLMKIKTGRKIK